MSTLHITDRDLEITRHGHLARFDDWSEQVAKTLAERDGLTLTDCHWLVINYVRSFFSEFEISPSPRLIVKGIGQELTLNAPCTRKTLDSLFPGGGCKQACCIAGLPKYYCHSC